MDLAYVHCKAAGINQHWGELMPIMAAEEFGELTKAVSKYERARVFSNLDVGGHKADIVDEIGDVILSVMALADRYGITADEIEQRITYKINQRK